MARERPVDPPPQDPSTETLDAARTSPMLPDRIGRYHIKRVIASGGMGTVYEATQDNPRRVVAVKVMKQGIASKSALRRFEYEGQILGRLRHPGIAQIYEAGTHDDGHGAVPYFAMEYIPNAKLITTYADEKKLGTRQRMELFAKVCDAIHHGHQKGIIHRDLKPGNILVDSTGQVKIIDFGVARCTDSDLAVTTLQTDVGQLIGTLQYMSPEQCEGDPHDIDTRSDVYALGVVFYQLLCGKLPYDVTRMAMHQATRAIRELHPTKLSTLDKTLRGDVETIALKALEKERERRYQSAADLGHDIHRYLTGEAILAHRASIIYQLRVFARRNKAVFASLAAVFIVLVAGIIVSTSLYVRAEHARLEQSRERERADTSATEATRERQRAIEAQRRDDVRALLNSLISANPGGVEKANAERFEKILEGVCNQLQSGDATMLDYQAFVNSFLTVEFVGRPIVDSHDVRSLLFRVWLSSRRAKVAKGLGMFLSFNLLLDGSPIKSLAFGDTCLYWLPYWIGSEGWQGGNLNPVISDSSELGYGAHRLHGHVRVQIVENLREDHKDLIEIDSSWGNVLAREGEDYRVIPEAVVDVPLHPLAFTVVGAYPDNYPPKIVNEEAARQIDNEVELEEFVVLPRHPFPDRLKDDRVGTATFPHLVVKVRLPHPKITISCDVTFSVADLGLATSFDLVGVDSQWGIAGKSNSKPISISLASDPGQDRLIAIYSLDEESSRRIGPGTTVQFTMAASEAVARRNPRVSEYLDLRIERSAVIGPISGGDAKNKP